MNTIWSKYVQGTGTLYLSRKLRFDDMFATQYKSTFNLDEKENLKLLEIGCGPGALAGALHRWYPNYEITGIDRDSEFIRFAKENEKGINFFEGDATALPFENNTFDVTISNTVSEHIEPSKFYSEQLRVLKPGGVCLVLSSRKGINTIPSCITFNNFEQQFWKKANKYDNSTEKYLVCQYPMSETELPIAMQEYGFENITTGFATIDLTPDNPKYPPSMAYDMINANRQTTLDGIYAVLNNMPQHFSKQDIEIMKQLTNVKYDERINKYNNGEKFWETDVSIIMIVRGIK
ncbi:MAG: methyltransferase domain-containing protein [Clostridia bacterium]|nr:methyltransferase domain-containing protein [Clostridia bacterium]